MDIRHLQIFQMVCDCGGITAAADRLNVTQPSVSIAIRELEAYYHVKLFDRINRGVYPTEAGHLLRQYADAILTPFAEAESVLRTGRAFVQCRIGVNVSVAEAYLGDWIETIRQTAPEIELTAFADNNERLDRLLTENRIDLAVYDGAIDRAAKTVLPLFTETEAAVCAPTLYDRETITPEELSHHPLLLRELGSGQRSAVDNALSRFGYTCAVTSVSTLALVELAAQGIGIAVVPMRLAKQVCAKYGLRLCAIVNETGAAAIQREYVLAHLRHKNLTPTMRSVMETLQHCAIGLVE